jgi:predicted methyltransferase
MRQIVIAAAAATSVLAVASVAIGAPPAQRDGIEAAVAAETRSEANVARDRYRHPSETLRFFGVEPDDTVVEIWPGGGWYTEILAPYLAAEGSLWAVAPQGGLGGIDRLRARDAATYAGIQTAVFPASAEGTGVPDGSADVVLTFRNVHNWRMGYGREGQDYAPDAFAQMFAMLKPGGTLGIVDHRLPEDASDEREKSSGYIKVSTVMKLAEGAGFEYVGASEVNANPLDTTDWEKGVWTLPPTFALKDQDRDRYAAIGESDRMTLKFRKPD